MARKKQETPESAKPNSQSASRGALWAILIILGFVTVIAIIVVASQGSFTGNVVKDTNQQVCKDVQVPYEDQEEYLKTEYYTETIPYQEDVPLKFEDNHLTDAGEWGCGSLTNYKKCFRVNVMNLDTMGGIFTVNCNFRTIKRTLSDSASNYVKPGDVGNFDCVADTDLGEDIDFTYQVVAPTKSVTSYKDVQRERQVTAYRPVTKYKTETQCS